MLTLPTEIVHAIGHNLSGSDIAKTACVNKELSRAMGDVHPWLRKALKQQRSITKTRSVLFGYKDSLNTYESIEYWAKMCVETRSQSLRDAIAHQLRLREFKEREQKVRGLTTEQETVVNTPPNGQVMAIQAYAGTGKTTTLYHYAKKWNDKKILYLAYNKALTDESKDRFTNLPHVHVMTIHSMALQSFGRNPPFELCKDLKKSFDATRIDEFERYCSTDLCEDSPSESVRDIWENMFETYTTPVTHDAYLKAFQRTQPILSDYDVIMLDEAQDCTDCVLDIVLRQTHATRIMVGDAFQKIYGFRHVNEAYRYIVEKSPNATLFQLSVSFRMGYSLMRYVNMYMNYTFRVSGFSESKRTQDTCIRFLKKRTFYDEMKTLPKGTVILCRYNINLLRVMFDLCANGVQCRVYGKSYNFDKELGIATDLTHILDENLHLVSRDKLRRFQTIEQLAEHYDNNNTWRTRLRLFRHYGGEALQRLWSASKNQQSGTTEHHDLVLTTAHQSKGCEFEHVVLYDDFLMNSQDAQNILYVAMTRAKSTLYMNETLSKFYKKVLKPNVYTFDTKVTSKFGTCSFCNRTSTNMLVCKENDHETIMEHNRCELYEYVTMCNLCKNNADN